MPADDPRDPFDEIQGELREPEPPPPAEIERVGAGYRMVFPESRVLFEVQRVHWHKEDAVAVYAISIIPVSATQRPRRIDHGTLNLQSSRVRSTLSKDLKDRHEADWKSILDEASAKIVEIETMGEDPVQLQSIDVASLPAPQLLGNICLDREPTMLFGHGGDGKSYIMLAAGISLVTGRALLDIKPSRVLNNVAVCDWEWSPQAHAIRMRRLVGEEDVPGLWHFICRKPLHQEVDRLAVQFRRLGIEYALFDSVAWACGGAPEESVMATAYQNALRVLDVGSLSVAHVNRKADTTMPFGSVFWHASMKTTYFLKKQIAEGSEKTISLILLNRKANSSALDKQVAFTMDFHEGRTTIVKTGADNLPPELRAQFPLKDRIVDLLKHRDAQTVAEIAKALKVTEGTVRDKVNQFKGRIFKALPPLEGQRGGRVGLLSHSTAPGTSSSTAPDAETSRAPAPAHDEASLRNEDLSTPKLSEGGGTAQLRESDETAPSLGEGSTSSRDGENGGAEWSCPSCGFDEYQPVEGGRLCLSCEKLTPLP